MGWEVDGNGEVDVREQDGSEKGVGGRVGFPKLGVEVVGRESWGRPRSFQGTEVAVLGKGRGHVEEVVE